MTGRLLAVALVLAALPSTTPAYGTSIHATNRRPPPDRTPPSAPVVDGLPQTYDIEPVFIFSAHDRRTPAARIRFECAIDAAALHPCTDEYSERVDFGRHVLRVRALDRAGNRSRITSFDFLVFALWDAADDMLLSPGQVNPNPDRYGNTPWRYMWSPSRAHDPSQYRLFTHYTVVDAFREQWDVGDFQPMPFPPRPLVGFDLSQRRILMHPYPEEFAVLGWKSPMSATIDYVGSIASTDPCSRGITWSIDKGATTLVSGTLGGGQSQRLEGSFTVTGGESIYFVLDPGPDDICDTSAVELTFTQSF